MLRAADYLENDKILTLLTAERGRLTVGIKGVKKAGAKLKFAAQPFCFAEYILAERGGRYTVIQASECESFYELRADVEKYYAACAVCETALALTYEGDGESGLFSDCVKALSAMCAGDCPSELISFLLTVLKMVGYGINTGVCHVCGKELTGEGKIRFDMDSGAFCHWDCGAGAGTGGDTFRVLVAAESGKNLPADNSFNIKEGQKRALKLLKEYLSYKTDAKCLSLSEYIKLI